MTRARLPCRLALATASALAALLPGLPADAATRDVEDRVFTLGTMVRPGPARAVSPDGTVWGTADFTVGGTGVWRLAPGATRTERVSWGRGTTDLSVTPDGGVLFDEAGARVLLRTPGGTVSAIAGAAAGPDATPTGADGAPANEATLCEVSAVQALPQNAALIVDRRGRVVRRVAGDGTITTVYATPGAASTYGCPADEPAPTARITDVGVDGTGAILLVTRNDRTDSARVLRQAPSGTWRTVGRLTATDGTFAVAASGDVFAVSHGIVRLDRRTGRVTRMLPEGIPPGEEEAPIFNRDGLPAARYFGHEPLGVAAAPDGGLVTTTTSVYEGLPLVSYIAPVHPRLQAVALEPGAGRATQAGYRLRYRATVAGTVAVTVLTLAGTEVFRGTDTVDAGAHAFSISRRLRFRTYAVNVTARTAGGRARTDTVHVYLGGRLPTTYARELIVPARFDTCEDSAFRADADECDPDLLPVRSEGCRRYGPRRVDCRWSFRDEDGDRTCVMASAQLDLDGTLAETRYSCPTERRFPSRPPVGRRVTLLPNQPDS